MPEITIVEKDYTTPGLGEYANFSVVVPGFGGPGCDDSVFDENGIFEVSSQKEFVEKVDTITTGSQTVVYAKPEVFTPDPEDTSITAGYVTKLSMREFYVDYADQVYSYVAGTPTSTQGKDWVRLQKGDTIEYYELTKVTDLSTEDIDPETGKTEDTYMIVRKGNEGSDASSAGTHYGNQMAYELLGLGYTVLFKKLTSISDLESPDFWEPLEDKANYDFRFIVTGLLQGSTTRAANKLADNLAATRGDCSAILDIDETSYIEQNSLSEIINGIKTEVEYTPVSKFSGFVVPSLCYKLSYSKKKNSEEYLYENTKFPGSFHYLACFAHSVRDLNFAEWYAIAGYTRGISSLSIDSTSVKLGESAIKALEPRVAVGSFNQAVNVIAKFRNNYILWGNRTAETLQVEGAGELIASHFMNIRQLCTTIKKELYIACRRFTFDPNSDVLWINFCNAIRPTLESMKADQGIDDYEIIKVDSDKKAELKARIRIVPIEAVEDFYIELSLEDSLGDTNVTITD